MSILLSYCGLVDARISASENDLAVLNLINIGTFNWTLGPGKNPKLLNLGPTFIPESRVVKYWVSF
jgi:hypothetical protein